MTILKSFRPLRSTAWHTAAGTVLAMVAMAVQAQDTADLATRYAVEVKATPDSVGRIVARLPARAPLQQLPGRFGPWIQVRTERGITGWVQTLEVSGSYLPALKVSPATPMSAPLPVTPRLSGTTPLAANAVAALPVDKPQARASSPVTANSTASSVPQLSAGEERLLQAETFRADSESARKFAFQAGLGLVKLPRALYTSTALDPTREAPQEPGKTSVDRSAARSWLEGYALHPDIGLQTYVNQLGRWLSLESTLPDLPWTFAVVDSPAIQSQATASGHVLLSGGLVGRLRSEAELAAVLAQGIAQVALARQLTGSSALTVAGTAAADQMAVVLLARTGFNPAAVIDAMQAGNPHGTGTSFMSALLGTDAASKARETGLRNFMGTRFDEYKPLARSQASPSIAQRLASLASRTAQ